MKRLLILSRSDVDACSWYRVAGPLSHIAKQMPEIEIVWHKEDSISWSELAFYDALFFYRPVTPANYKAIDISKNMGLKVWIDYDDDLLNIPLANPCFKDFANPEIKKSVSQCIAAADVVTVSTSYLKDVYLPLNNNILEIRNAYDADRLKPHREKFVSQSRSNVVLWRGSRTHDADLDYFLPSIRQAAEKFKDWVFIFLGAPYWKVLKELPQRNCVQAEGVPLPKFFNHILSIKPGISIVPLVEDKFNQSKSNIAWQEATHAGAWSLRPHWTHWDTPQSRSYDPKDPAQFARELINMMSRPMDVIQQAVATDWEFLLETQSLTIINEKRRDLLMNLFG